MNKELMDIYQRALNYCINHDCANFTINHSDMSGFSIEWNDGKNRCWIDKQGALPTIYRACGPKESTIQMVYALQINESEVNFID